VSEKGRVAEKLMVPVIAAGASLAARYVAKRGPEFVEDTFLPWLRETAEGAGGVAEKLPDKARSAVSSGGDLAEQLTDQARGVTGLGGGSAEGGNDEDRGLSPDELSERSEERAKRRAQRRKATNRK
jgi:hypothetical protein